jgi:AcrR family transcriptional regulator
MSPEELRKGQHTRAAIVDAAHELFITQGYHGTSMRQIAQNAEIALGGIYNHFSGKADIFGAIFIDKHPFLAMLPAIEAAQGESIEELVRDAAAKMLATFRDKTDFLNLMFIEIVEFKSAHAQEMFATAFPRGLEIVQKIATAEGHLRSLPPQMVVRAFVSMFFSYFLAEVILGPVAPPEFSENAMDHQIDILLHGILEKE